MKFIDVISNESVEMKWISSKNVNDSYYCLVNKEEFVTFRARIKMSIGDPVILENNEKKYIGIYDGAELFFEHENDWDHIFRSKYSSEWEESQQFELRIRQTENLFFLQLIEQKKKERQKRNMFNVISSLWAR